MWEGINKNNHRNTFKNYHSKKVIRAEQDLPGTEGREWGREWGRGAGQRNDPNNVCTCE
jgi:hypothetical protein